MAVQLVGAGASATLVGSGEETSKALHATLKAIPHSVCHAQHSVKFNLIAAQAANSRLYELRNNGANIIIPTKVKVDWIQTAAHTAQILDAIDMFKVTGFTVIDGTATVTPTFSLKRTSMSAGNVQARHVTVAGATAGMTGGTLVKDGNALSMMEQVFQAAVPTTPVVGPSTKEFIRGDQNIYPLVLVQNEGFILENRILLGAAAGSSVVVEVEYAEVTAY